MKIDRASRYRDKLNLITRGAGQIEDWQGRIASAGDCRGRRRIAKF